MFQIKAISFDLKKILYSWMIKYKPIAVSIAEEELIQVTTEIESDLQM